MAIRRCLAEAEPDVYTDDLAIALLNESLVLSRQDPRSDDRCLKVVDECVDLRRRLTRTRSSYAPKLVSALKSRAVVLDRMGRSAEAQQALVEASEL